jgi:hypothetical protein
MTRAPNPYALHSANEAAMLACDSRMLRFAAWLEAWQGRRLARRVAKALRAQGVGAKVCR